MIEEGERCVDTSVRNRLRSFICTELVMMPIDELRDSDWLPQRRVSPDGNVGFLNSLAMAGLLVFVEDEIGRDLEDDEGIPENFATVDRMLSFIARNLT